MELKFKVLVGNNVGQEVKIAGPKFFIGRAEDCHLRPRSDLISRHHCVLIVEEKLVAVRDFGSKNGTYVNAERVASERELRAEAEARAEEESGSKGRWQLAAFGLGALAVAGFLGGTALGSKGRRHADRTS